MVFEGNGSCSQLGGLVSRVAKTGICGGVLTEPACHVSTAYFFKAKHEGQCFREYLMPASDVLSSASPNANC